MWTKQDVDQAMEPCPGSSRYLRSVDPTQRFLGKGGACLSVEKWWDTKQHCWVAVKHLDGSSKHVRSELQVLRHIADQEIPRAVATIDEEQHGPNSNFVVMELVQGMTLQEFCHEAVKQGQLAASENRMLPVAAQLFDTLQALHDRAHVAHMDLTSVNVMIRHDALKDFDNMRLMDFGFSKRCRTGQRNVAPMGFTSEYAAPEVLHSIICRFSKDRRRYGMVDGPAADVFSAGIVLYQMLTGCVPFSLHNIDCSKIQVRKEVPEDAREQWQMAAAVLQLHTSWVEAWGQNARGEAVRHPILDNIRRCSSTPDEAVDFFSRILNCLTDKRPTAAQALEHPYIRRCVAQMRACQQSQPACIQDPPLPIPAPIPALEDEAHTAPIPISTLEDEAHIAPVKQKLLVRVGGAVKKHGGRLARTAGHMLKSLPMFSCTSASNDTGGSDRASSSSMSSSGSCSSSSTKPPLSAYFFDYKHEVEQHSLMQGDKGASTGGTQLYNVREPDSTRQEQPSGVLGMDDKVSSRAINIQARTCKQQAVIDQQTSGAPKVPAAQAVLLAASCQPDLSQSPAEYGADQEQTPPVLSASRPKKRGWMKKLAVAGALAGVGCLLYFFRR